MECAHGRGPFVETNAAMETVDATLGPPRLTTTRPADGPRHHSPTLAITAGQSHPWMDTSDEGRSSSVRRLITILHLLDSRLPHVASLVPAPQHHPLRDCDAVRRPQITARPELRLAQTLASSIAMPRSNPPTAHADACSRPSWPAAHCNHSSVAPPPSDHKATRR